MQMLGFRNMKPLIWVAASGMGIHRLTRKSIPFTIALGCLIKIVRCFFSDPAVYICSLSTFTTTLGVGGRMAVLHMGKLRLRKVQACLRSFVGLEPCTGSPFPPGHRMGHPRWQSWGLSPQKGSAFVVNLEIGTLVDTAVPSAFG